MADLEIAIRAADATDADALALVGQATFLETYAGSHSRADIVAHCAVHHTPDAYRRLLGGDVRAWLAEVEPGRAPVGYALVGPASGAPAEPGDLEVLRIYVLQPYQGRRLGVRLMNEAVAAASAAGARRLLLGVYPENGLALGFYTRAGFRRIGTRPFTVGARVDHDFILARDLA
jgi:ribosomal protein S18 acetylase RimI-like enzyme